MTGQAFYLTTAHAFSCRPGVTSVSAFVCPWDPGDEISFSVLLLAGSMIVRSHFTAACLSFPTK